MKKSIITLITLAVLLVFSIGLFAQNHDNCTTNKAESRREMKQDMRQGEHPRMNMMDELKLTDKQKDDIEKLRANHRKEIIAIQAEIKIKNIDMKQAMDASDFNRAKTINKEIFAKKELIGQKRIDMHESMMKILTPEQREIFKKNPHFMNERRHDGMGDDDCDKPMGGRHQGMKK